MAQRKKYRKKHLPTHLSSDINDQKRSFGEILKEERLLLNLTQAEFGKLLGISASYVSSLENGRRTVSSKIINSFHNQFSYSYDYILGDKILDNHQLLMEPSESYGAKCDLMLLLQNCTLEEIKTCYTICHSFLATTRAKSTPDRKKQKQL